MQLQKTPAVSNLWLAVSAWLAQLAPTTQTTYVSVIKEFCSFLGAQAGTGVAATLLQEVRAPQALAFVQAAKNQLGHRPRYQKKGVSKAAPATIYKKIMVLRRLYGVLVAHQLVPTNPFLRELLPVPNPQGGRKRDTEMLPFDSVRPLMKSIEEGPRETRDSAILACLFGGGLRRGEIVKLLVADVARTSQGTTYLALSKTKDGQDHRQALPAWAAERVWALVAERRTMGALPEDPLFVTYTGQGGQTPTTRAMPACAVYHLFRRSCEKIGLAPHYSPHSARATAITKLLADGVPHRQVQEFSRHKSITMVEVYDKRRFEVDHSPAKSLSF